MRYSDHAIDQMQNRGIMPSVVKNTLECGSVRQSIATPCRRIFYESINNVSVTVEEDGVIVTTTRGISR